MKKSNVVLSTLLIAFSSVSFAGISVTDSNNGAWLTVTDKGQPAVNAMVSVENLPQIQSTFQTDSHGRVFVPLSLNRSTSVKYKAVTEDGQAFSRFAFHSDSRNENKS